MNPWEREKPDSANAPVPAPVQAPFGRSGSLTRGELLLYFEESRRQALARIDAGNFELEMRRDFAQRRLRKLQG